MTSDARRTVYAIADDHAMHPIEPGSLDDDRLHAALNRVEEDAVHAAAEKIRNMPMTLGEIESLMAVANKIDPYFLVTVKLPPLSILDGSAKNTTCWHHRGTGQRLPHVPVKEN